MLSGGLPAAISLDAAVSSGCSFNLPHDGTASTTTQPNDTEKPRRYEVAGDREKDIR